MSSSDNNDACAIQIYTSASTQLTPGIPVPYATKGLTVDMPSQSFTMVIGTTHEPGIINNIAKPAAMEVNSYGQGGPALHRLAAGQNSHTQGGSGGVHQVYTLGGGPASGGGKGGSAFHQVLGGGGGQQGGGGGISQRYAYGGSASAGGEAGGNAIIQDLVFNAQGEKEAQYLLSGPTTDSSSQVIAQWDVCGQSTKCPESGCLLQLARNKSTCQLIAAGLPKFTGKPDETANLAPFSIYVDSENNLKQYRPSTTSKETTQCPGLEYHSTDLSVPDSWCNVPGQGKDNPGVCAKRMCS